MPVSVRGRGEDREALISEECGGVGRWDLASLILTLRIEEVFTLSRCREPWLRIGVPVSVRGRAEERQAPISEGCGGYCFSGLRIWQVFMCQICPRRGLFHAEAAMLVMRKIRGIVLRCFISNV